MVTAICSNHLDLRFKFGHWQIVFSRNCIERFKTTKRGRERPNDTKIVKNGLIRIIHFYAHNTLSEEKVTTKGLKIDEIRTTTSVDEIKINESEN